MKFKIFASFVWRDCECGHGYCGNGWDDFEIIVHSNSKDNARKKIWKWAKTGGATQRQINFVDDKIWKRDKMYKTTYIK